MIKAVALLAAVGACIWSSLLILHAMSDTYYSEDAYMNPQEQQNKKDNLRSFQEEENEE